jgi:predicted adenine nucleotide alpha hydrolase (AANH) superfamily ATPase
MIRAYMIIITMVVCFLTLGGSLMADEKNTKTISEIGNDIQQIPTKVSTHLQNEWIKTKEYQREGWAESKAQFIRTKEAIVSLFKGKN